LAGEGSKGSEREREREKALRSSKTDGMHRTHGNGEVHEVPDLGRLIIQYRSLAGPGPCAQHGGGISFLRRGLETIAAVAAFAH